MPSLPTVKDAQGAEYRLRHLGYEHLFDLGEIINDAHERGYERMQLRLRYLDHQSQADAFAAAVLLGAPASRARLVEWMADALQTDSATIRDPEKFPLGVLARTARALITHPDVKEFFFEIVGAKVAQAALESLTQMVSGWLSTSSSPDTGEPVESG